MKGHEKDGLFKGRRRLSQISLWEDYKWRTWAGERRQHIHTHTPPPSPTECWLTATPCSQCRREIWDLPCHDVGPRPKKRAFLANAALQAWSKTVSGLNGVGSITNVGYPDPSGAPLRCALKYKLPCPIRADKKSNRRPRSWEIALLKPKPLA